jgi:catechol 2,3-dioxygenase-like lactoylglutathione lyase family enzyme
MFQKRQPTPGLGSVLDHIAFSVADVDATMRRLQETGVKIVQPARDVPELFRMGLIEDPWGTRIEIVQDSAKPRLHHVHLQGPDPAATLAWFADKLGQKTTKLKGVDGINLGGVWLLVQRGASTPSLGHSIDHIGFRPLNVDNAVAELRAKNGR